ncbi:hypothetical protein Ancab_028173 [Ancistrocladus abbreviatus]
MRLEYDQIRKVVTDSITATLKERLASSKNYLGDLLDHLLRDQHAEKFLSEDFIVNIVFGLLLASSESISVIVTLVLKFLAENPQALEELLVEHEGVMKNRENPGSPLTWNEVKSMNFTLHDLKPDVISKNFMPFGGGTRQCAGAELAKALIITFLHVLLTKYSPYLKLPSNQVSNLQARVGAPSFLSLSVSIRVHPGRLRLIAFFYFKPEKAFVFCCIKNLGERERDVMLLKKAGNRDGVIVRRRDSVSRHLLKYLVVVLQRKEMERAWSKKHTPSRFNGLALDWRDSSAHYSLLFP